MVVRCFAGLYYDSSCLMAEHTMSHVQQASYLLAMGLAIETSPLMIFGVEGEDV